jgi:LPXTG-motif cell wall-anchored protein
VVQVRVVAAAAPGAVTNTATVVADSTDPNTADNSDSASITITAAGSQAPVPPAASSGSTGSTSGVTLPRTGNGSLTPPLTLAGLLLFGGISSLVIARRRRAAMA